MTPAKRRRLLRSILVLAIVMAAGVAGRMWFRGETIPSLLMGRKPGSADPGTVLIRPLPMARTNSAPRHVSMDVPSSRQHGSPLKTKFDLLMSWTYVEGKTPVPQKVRELDGKWIEISGFMLPINETQKITRFILIKSLWGCCFGQTPQVNHIIVVSMEPGKAVDFYPDPVTVTGRFSVGETREEGYLVSVYRLEAESVVVR